MVTQALGAAHGREALDLLQAAAQKPALILLDLMMPVMDGRRFRQEQLGRAELAAIPVVVISAYMDTQEHDAELQAAAYLNKPLSLATLLPLLRALCPPPG